MKKKPYLSKQERLWWLKEDIQWNQIGADVVNRPTEVEALNNINNQAKHIREMGFDLESIKLTQLERKIYALDLEVLSERFDAKHHPQVLIKDSNIRRISKISGYSEAYVMRKLKIISKKMYLAELFHLNPLEDRLIESQKTRRQKLTRKWLEYKKLKKVV